MSEKTCPKCGSFEFYKSGRCAACARAYAKQHRTDNPALIRAAQERWKTKSVEHRKAYMKEWRKQNAERLSEYDAAYKAGNHQKIRAREKAYRAANRDKVRDWAKSFRVRNREKVAAWNVAYHLMNAATIRKKVLCWQRENPDKCRVRNQNRRARQADGKLSKDIIERLYTLQRGKCPCCGKPLGKDFHLDHIVPLAKGGLNVDSNIQLLRKRCNHNKSAKSPVEFMQSRGFLL